MQSGIGQVMGKVLEQFFCNGMFWPSFLREIGKGMYGMDP